MPSLVEAATNDESLAVQLAAVSSIHRIGVDELIQLLLYHEDPLIREAAADGLRVAGSSKGVDALRQALASDVDERVRTAAVKALEKIGGEKAELGLLDAAVNDESPIVRETAVRALGGRNLGSAVDEIVTLLEEDDSGAVREAAAWALGELEQPESLRALLDSRSDDPVEAVRIASEEALHAWGLAALAHVLQESDDAEQRIVAAQLLGELGDDEAAPFLGRALNDADASVRDAALGALQTLGAYVGLENGSGLLSNEAGFNSLIGGTTTLAATEPLDTPVFRVKGAHHTGYLRTSVGEVYAEGRWLALEATGHAHETFTDALPHGDIQPMFFDEYAHTDKITVSRLIGIQQFPAGLVPTSKRLDRIEARGTFWKERATFSLATPTNSYSWTSKVETLSAARLNAAGKWTGPSALSYTALPVWVRQGRIHDLAVEITAGHSTPYAQAKAIERYLRATYTYRFAESPEDAQPPEGRDAVDWFLFDKQEGTCGSFSSAFVLLARAVGLPARVVSGWAIAPTPYVQTVSADQAHQWAEVALNGIGWVDFDPTPGGAGARAALRALDNGGLDGFYGSGGSDDPDRSGGSGASGGSGNSESFLADLEDAVDKSSVLENGGIVLEKGGKRYFIPGSTTAQSAGLLHTPLFKVTGATNTSYLRTASGDVYQDGRWRQLDPAVFDIPLGADVTSVIWGHYSNGSGDFASLPFERRGNASLLGVFRYSGVIQPDEISVRAFNANTGLPSGVMPVARDLDSVTLQGQYYPFSRTFRTDASTSSYSMVASVRSYPTSQYEGARAASDPTYLQLPPDLPPRIRDLALRITRGHTSPYVKARAIARYLQTNYPYRFADGPEDAPPPGRDPVDWFLFDHQEGTCGVFSSAFAVLARSIGIPARVVSGWAIKSTAGEQTVYSDQAHQWAEIALDDIGWVTFEPTASGGAQSRASGGASSGGGPSGGSSSEAGGSTPDEPPPPPLKPLTTVTNITSWPAEVRRGHPLTVGGTVYTATGHTVDGMEVEIYVNETKEQGGTIIGTAVTRFGTWSAEVRMPREMERGPYQLLARAVANTHFEESWSDPDISVFSGTGIELTGPTRVPVDNEARFSGRLSEETGSGIPGRELEIIVDGTVIDSITTGEFGRFSFTQAFPDPGPHWVEVELKVQDYLLDNKARIDLEVTLPTVTTVEAPVSVEVGEEFSASGTLHGARGEPLAGRPVSVRIDGLPLQQVSTDDAGVFEYTGMLDAPGAVTVLAEFTGDGPVLSSEATARLAVREVALLTLNGPSPIELGGGARFTGRLTTAADAPIGQSTLTIVDDGGGELATVTTDDNGGFAYEHSSFFVTGPQSLTAQYPGADFIVPSSARFAFSVLAPTSMSLEAPEIVRDSLTFTLRGNLRDGNGQPVPEAEVEVTDGGERTLTTDAEGNFSWETVALFDGGSVDSPHESPLVVGVAFAGTDHRAPSAAAADVVIGVPRVLLEPLEMVARGDAVTLRGTALLGNRPMEGVELTVGDQGGAVSDATGAFDFRYQVSSDHPLGTSEVTVAATDLNISASVQFEVRSAPNMIVTPVETLRPGELAMLHVTLLDDRWEGIPRATLRMNDDEVVLRTAWARRWWRSCRRKQKRS